MHLRALIYSAAFILLVGEACCVGAFEGDPPDDRHPWAVHDGNRPQPPVVAPGKNFGDAPSDAVVLFDGSAESFANWQHEKPEDARKGSWRLKDGALECVAGAGYLVTKEEFGDCQLHIEWAAPAEVKGQGQGRGNSGVFFLNGMVEVQVLDNYQNPSYADGMAGSVYGVMPPAANALRAPGEWQSYDIIFRRPIVRDGKVLDPGSLTVLCNGVVVQDSTPINGGGGHKARKPLDRVFPEQGKLKLQDHGNPVRFRNIWYRSLRPRALDGGTDGRISPAASLAKRAEIAKDIREDASSLKGIHKALRLYESLVYAPNKAALQEADQLTKAYLENGKLNGQKGMYLKLRTAFRYMQKFKILPQDHFALPKVQAVVADQGWSKKR
ncbi:MAG: 3-keto-disaccharide hydrolase [Coraliomargarita sp.]